ncbi:hypothetical protein [Streptomyces griseofuscus]|uniref:hypothetical protein n=1 Tax=Streptomyces griseofuscus TaxID=146922 RepID=UPI00155A0E00|nr:hypothetical protein [Streptomyces griseofuscus]
MHQNVLFVGFQSAGPLSGFELLDDSDAINFATGAVLLPFFSLLSRAVIMGSTA